MLLRTKRLILRNYTPSDAADLHEIFSDPVVMKDCEMPYLPEQTQSILSLFIEKGIAFAAVLPDTGKVIDKVGSGNKLISAGETVTLRFFGIIKLEPESLNDGFTLNVTVPNSKGEYENFQYQVPAV